VVAQIERNPSALGLWLADLSARSHRNVTVVALANEMGSNRMGDLNQGDAVLRPFTGCGMNEGIGKATPWKSQKS
jgi:hypothetical protein